LIKAKKRFGQNFLIDDSIKDKIIQSMPNGSNMIVEIGPGLGDLTIKLLDKCENLVAFEIDLELCEYLHKKFESSVASNKLRLICNDVLEEWAENSLVKEKYHLVANLPYYIATNIILRALEDKKCESILVMIQKEVAQKFAAHEGEKVFSSLSVLASSICKVELLFDVGSKCFDPPPKITSSVLKFVKFQEYISDEDHEGLFSTNNELKEFKNFLKVAFCAPRKTLLKNLKSFYDKDKLIEVFSTLELQQNVRPHQLSTKTYHLLFKKIR
jgi:16S rRNA (adenine1518-N6/adenine1519-N6)-dimethyltransferase